MALAVGTAAADITPPPGLDIAGNLWATQSTGTRAPLRCKVLVLDDGNTRAALVALDLLGIDRFARVVKYYANEYVKLIERGPIPVETAAVRPSQDRRSATG